MFDRILNSYIFLNKSYEVRFTTPQPPPLSNIHNNKQITPTTKCTQLSKKQTVGLLKSFPMFRRLSCQPAALQFNSDKSHQTPAQPPSSPEPKRANLQKCINQTGLFPSLTVSAGSDLCDKNQAAVAALPQLPFPEKCINFADFQTGRVETGFS